MSGMKKRENGKRLGNRRLFSMGLFGASVLFLLLVAVFGYVWQDAASVTDFSRKNLPPCAGYLFGTDWMGRDMFVRTVAGLSMSIRLGLLTAAVSAVIAFLLGLSAAVLGRAVDGLDPSDRSGHGDPPHAASDPDLLCLRKGLLGRDPWHRTYPLGVFGQADPRGGVPAPGESVYPDRREAGKEQGLSCVPSYGTESSATVYHRADPHVPPCHPPRGQHHLSGVRPFAGGTGHWDHFIGEHEISGHGKMVAGAVSGASSDGGGADVPLCGTDHMPDGGSGQCP